MLLEIDDNKTVGELEDRFNECFPYLKLELYTKAHGWHGRSLPADKIAGDKKIGDISKKHRQAVLAIRSGQKAGQVEKIFKQQF
ncbi:MAG TPA: hypothetical protein VHB48_09570, partial [Chitinophagaceae bacterium]|nr:hypothetical protein [Chitinophagaceae bacterium]